MRRLQSDPFADTDVGRQLDAARVWVAFPVGQNVQQLVTPTPRNLFQEVSSVQQRSYLVVTQS